ncbi:MAG TPA: hypothetical protein VE780_10365 [Thermoleophilaceae bacterium]|jgi:hypothetical protein|nr:hypothetical protein [Thermoleophilaceae bacterium]
MSDIPEQVSTVVGPPVEVRQLLYELIDAHADTVELATRVATGVAWSAHISYIQDLQRLAQETLACMDR